MKLNCFIYILGTVMLGNVANAQFTLTNNPAPTTPNETIYINMVKPKNDLKSYTMVLRMDSFSNRNDDTLYHVAFDKEGNQIMNKNYENGRLRDFYETSYEKGLPVKIYSTRLGDPKNSHNYLVLKTYNSAKQITNIKGYNFLNKDTLQRSLENYFYDKKNRLLKKEIINDGRRVLKEEYTYEADNLKPKTFKTNSGENAKNFYEQMFYYNNQNNLIKSEWRQHLGTASIYAGFQAYNYNNNKLASELFSGFGSPNKLTSVQYVYNADNMLDSMIVQRDSLWGAGKYEYENGFIKKVSVRSNAPNGLLQFRIPTLYVGLNSFSPLPYLYEEKYFYDEKQNLMAREYFLDGILKRRVEYLLEY